MLGIYGIPAGAGTPADMPVAHHLHLQAHQLVAAALFDRRLGCDHPDGGDAASWSICQQKVVSGALHHRRRKAFPTPAVMKLGPWRFFPPRPLGRVSRHVVVGGLPTLSAAYRRGPSAKFLFIRNFESLFDTRNIRSFISSGCSTIRWRCARSSTRWRSP